METRKSYPSDVTDDEWAFVAPYLTLMRELRAAIAERGLAAYTAAFREQRESGKVAGSGGADTGIISG